MSKIQVLKWALTNAPKLTKAFQKAPATISKAYNYTTRGIKMMPNIIFEHGGDTFVKGASKAAKAAAKGDKTWWQVIKEGIKGGGRSVEHNMSLYKKSGNFFTRAIGRFRKIPKDISKAIAKETAGKTTLYGKLWGGTKGVFKGLGKSFPFWLNTLFVASEIPNVISATKDEGIVQGGAEAGKSAAKLTGATIGAAALSGIPLIGGIAGWLLGEKLTSGVVGDSYSEKKAEAEARQQELISQLQENGYTIVPQRVPQMQNFNIYG